jgi:hypothetical protein
LDTVGAERLCGQKRGQAEAGLLVLFGSEISFGVVTVLLYYCRDSLLHDWTPSAFCEFPGRFAGRWCAVKRKKAGSRSYLPVKG